MEIAVEPKPYFKQLLFGSSCDANFVQVEKCCFVACRDPFQKATNLEERLDLLEKNDELAFFGEVRSFFSKPLLLHPGSNQSRFCPPCFLQIFCQILRRLLIRFQRAKVDQHINKTILECSKSCNKSIENEIIFYEFLLL